jgi:hypothetical protein
VTLLLVQEQPPDDLPYPAIGCYVTKGNGTLDLSSPLHHAHTHTHTTRTRRSHLQWCTEWGFPVVEAEGDIIKKTAFENGQDSASLLSTSHCSDLLLL